ncbi:uncharacterized protein LOC144623645 [Crassostrea virginica]
MNDLEFFSATIGDTIFYKGQLCKFVEDGNHQIGRIETFIENVQDQIPQAVISTVERLSKKPPECPSEKAFLVTGNKKYISIRDLRHRQLKNDESFYQKENSIDRLTGPISLQDSSYGIFVEGITVEDHGMHSKGEEFEPES